MCCLVFHGHAWFFHGNTWSFCDCIIAESHSMLYNRVNISLNSLQINLSMLPSKFVVKTIKNCQYKTAGDCLKGFYAAHQVLKLILCIKASLQVVLGTLAIPKYAKVLLCSDCFSRYCLIVSRLHHRRIDWVSVSLHSLQLVPCWPWNWWSKRWKDGQYKTAGDSLNIPKITILHGIGCGLNLNISFHCSSVFWEYGQRLVEYGQAIDQVLRLILCIKASFEVVLGTLAIASYAKVFRTKFGLWQKTKHRMALDRPIDQTIKSVIKS